MSSTEDPRDGETPGSDAGEGTLDAAPDAAAPDASSGVPHSAAAHDRPTPVAPEPAPTGPSARLSGLWFGGTLAWASSVLLVLDQVGAVDRSSGPILWVHALAFALYGCTQVGAGLRAGETGVPVRRGVVVLATGVGVVAGFAILLGVLLPVNARGAYVLLGLYGMAVFFFAQRRVRQELPPQTPGSRSPLRVVQVVAVLITAVVWVLDR